MQYGEAPTGHFDTRAGDLCLCFANTVDWHASDHPEEQLNSYADLLTWAQHMRLLTPERAERLLSVSQQRPDDAATTLERAIELREGIYRLFAAIAHDEPVTKRDLSAVNDSVPRPLAHLRVVEDNGVFDWGWSDGGQALDQMLWPVVHAALTLLTSGSLDRIGQCEDDRGCGWLFYDASRNRSRRWCSMETCGNRAKVRRHLTSRRGE